MLLVVGIPAVVGVLLHVWGRATVLIPLLEETVAQDFADVLPVVRVVNSLGFAAALSLILANCVILWPPYGGTSGGGLASLSARARQLKAALYAGTLLLVGSVFLMRSLFQWSSTFVARSDGTDWKILEGLNATVISVEGACTP